MSEKSTFRPRTLFGNMRRTLRTRRRWGAFLKLIVLLVSGVGIPLLAMLPRWLEWPRGANSDQALFWLVVAWVLLTLSMLVPGWFIRLTTRSDVQTLWDRAEVVEGVVEGTQTTTLPITGERAILVTYRYSDAKDVEHQDLHWLRGASYDRIITNMGGPSCLTEGASLQVAYDPDEPSVNLVPAFADNLFETVRHDRRSVLIPERRTTPQADLSAPVTIALYEDARQAAREGGLLGRRLRCGMTLDERGLSFEDGGGALRIEWAKGITVLLTTWIVSTHEADLHLQLRQRGWDVSTPSIRLSVRLKQSEIDSKVLLKEAFNPYISPRDLARLWQMLLHCTELQGERLGDKARPSSVEVLRQVERFKAQRQA